MDYISEYITRKKNIQTVTKSLPLNQQKYWNDFLTQSDRKESSAERQNRRKTVSLDYKIKNEKNNDETSVLDLFIDNTHTAIDFIIQKEEEEFIHSMLPKLEVILQKLPELDRKIILLYFQNDKVPSFREMGRKLNVDYRKIQRRIPRILLQIETQLKTSTLKKN